MALADLIPGAVEIIREEGRIEGREQGRLEGSEQKHRELLIKILTKKLKDKPSKEILSLINKSSTEILDKIEDKIFDITSWEEIEEIIK